MSFSMDQFNNDAKWRVQTAGLGSIIDRTAASMRAFLAASGDGAWLVSVTPQDLSECDLRIRLDRQAARAGIALTAGIESDQFETLGYVFLRDAAFGLVIYGGGGSPYQGVDPVPTDQQAEMRIVISGGNISFYYEGNLIYTAPLVPWAPSPISLHIAVGTVADIFSTVITGTTTFSSEPSPPPPLRVTVAPPSAGLLVGQTQEFTATPQGGSFPYTIRWIDNATNNILGSGSNYSFIAMVVGNYGIYAEVTDNVGTVATSSIISIVVSAEATQILIDSMEETYPWAWAFCNLATRSKLTEGNYAFLVTIPAPLPAGRLYLTRYGEYPDLSTEQYVVIDMIQSERKPWAVEIQDTNGNATTVIIQETNGHLIIPLTSFAGVNLASTQSISIGAQAPLDINYWAVLDFMRTEATIPPPLDLAILQGTITDADTGLGIPGAKVAIDGLSIYTNANGTYSVQLPLGIYQVNTSALGYSPQTASVTLTSGPPTNQNFALQPIPPVTISGIVTDNQTGNPLSGVAILADSLYSAMTDINGNYQLSLVPTSYVLSFSKNGYIPSTLLVDASSGNVIGADKTLYPLGTEPTPPNISHISVEGNLVRTTRTPGLSIATFYAWFLDTSSGWIPGEGQRWDDSTFTQWNLSYVRAMLRNIKEVFKCNTVRVFFWMDWVLTNSRDTMSTLYPQSDIGNRDALHAFCDIADEEGLDVELRMWDWNPTQGKTEPLTHHTEAQFIDAWVQFATEFSRHTNLFFNLYDETAMELTAWRNLALTTILAIRNAGIGHVIYVHWLYAGGEGIDWIRQFGNHYQVAYSRHEYVFHGTTEAMHQETIQIKNEGYPVTMTAGGVFQENPVEIGVYRRWYPEFLRSNIGITLYNYGRPNIADWRIMQDTPFPCPPNPVGQMYIDAINSFQPQTHTLTISSTAGGTTSPAPSVYSYNEGMIVPVTAIPDSNYRFLFWELDGVNVGSTNPINVTMNANHTLNAVFEYVPPPPVTITLTANAGANGSVVPQGTVEMIVGQAYQFQATPNSGYNFDHWDLGGENKGSSNPLQLTATVDMDGKTLTALFSAIPPTPVNVTIAISGNGTTDLTPGTHEFHVGDTITIAAIPSAGNAFKQWQLDGMTYTDNPLSLPVTEALNGQTLTAEFISLTPQAASLLIPAVAVITLIGIGAAYSLLKKKGGR